MKAISGAIASIIYLYKGFAVLRSLYLETERKDRAISYQDKEIAPPNFCISAKISKHCISSLN
ncbi:hypothetical protein [Chamaesiphon sp.]|uniref:hypothetical protein n=1 Tax=Chamaesiphon sp. TaxID=2814140 RepID=UPI0035932F59